MMLNHVREPKAAASLQAAVESVYRSGKGLTADVGGHSSTLEFADTVIAALR
jgi:isocitrate/isopropylmalate dehydrogenase